MVVRGSIRTLNCIKNARKIAKYLVKKFGCGYSLFGVQTLDFSSYSTHHKRLSYIWCHVRKVMNPKNTPANNTRFSSSFTKSSVMSTAPSSSSTTASDAIGLTLADLIEAWISEDKLYGLRNLNEWFEHTKQLISVYKFINEVKLSIVGYLVADNV